MQFSAQFRYIMLATCSLALTTSVLKAAPAVHHTSDSRPLVQRVIELPQTKDVQVTLIRGTIYPGESTGWHVHLYPQTSYLLSGSVVLENLNGSKIIRMSAGTAATEPAGVVMRATNPSKTVPAIILLFQVTLPGKPAVKSWHV